jgi:phospholipid/cholesterol/gamma-HCH transport system substrate-binding protein
MKFTIRFADQVVGALVIAALGALVFVIVMLGGRHRWFARDYLYTTYLDTAAGLSSNMAVQYKGFTIGNIKSFVLTDDNRVKVIFSVYDTYNNRARRGSIVELAVSPLGLGNHFYLYPGRGEPLEENEFIPAVNSPEARRLQREGLAEVLVQEDSITLLISRANALLGDLDQTVLLVQEAVTGTGDSSLGRIVQETEKLARGGGQAVEDLPKILDETLAILLRDLEPALADLRLITGELANPDNLLMSALDAEGFVYTNLESSLDSISGMMENLDRTAALLPAELAQVAGFLAELRAALKTANDVLVALSNNPLLRKGIPPPVHSQPGGTSSRDISF